MAKKTKARPGHGKAVKTRIQEQIDRAVRKENADLAKALGVWAELPRPAQASMVREVAETRNQELRLAYKDAIGIAYGKRSRRGKTVDEECITFLVKYKWPKGLKSRRRSRANHLPEYLWAMAPQPWSSERIMCAIPTDVEALDDNSPVPHAAPGEGIDMKAAGRKSPWFGTVTCAVRIPDDQRPHALTCYHVAGMADGAGSAPNATPKAFLRTGSALLGSTWWPWTGNLVRPPKKSFDAALMEVPPGSLEALKQTVKGFEATAVLRPSESVPVLCKILVPGREPVAAIYKQTWVDYDRINYFTSGAQPTHARLFEFEIVNPTGAIGGDSGSAVVNDDGWQFIGMYLAGVDGQNSRFILPAYFLVEGSNYGNSGQLKIISKL